MTRNKLELKWVGKEDRPRLEPRVLIEDAALSYSAPIEPVRLNEGDSLVWIALSAGAASATDR